MTQQTAAKTLFGQPLGKFSTVSAIRIGILYLLVHLIQFFSTEQCLFFTSA